MKIIQLMWFVCAALLCVVQASYGRGKASLFPIHVSRGKELVMYIRFKKLFGSIVLVALVIGYALATMIFAETQLNRASSGTLLAFFAVTGVLWILPAMGLIWWMEKKPKG